MISVVIFEERSFKITIYLCYDVHFCIKEVQRFENWHAEKLNNILIPTLHLNKTKVLLNKREPNEIVVKRVEVICIRYSREF